MRSLATLLTLCAKEFKVITRDRQAAALLFLMPAAFVLLLSLALEDIYGAMVGTRLPVVLEVEDDGEFAKRVEQALRDAGNFDFVERPGNMDDREMFRSGEVRAVIRIPDGFSERVGELLAGGSTDGESGLGSARIAWQASPTLDASYRWFVEAQLGIVCLGLVQAELVKAQEEAGRDLERLGEEYQAMGEKLKEVAGQLQGTVGQLEDMQTLMNSSPAEFEALGMAALAESAARAEARAALDAMEIPAELQAGDLVFEELLPVEEGQEVVFAPLVPRSETLSPRAAELAKLIEESGVPPAWLEELQERHAAGSRVGGVSADEATEAELFLSHTGGERDELPTPLQQTVPGWALFAMFFIVVPLAQGLHRERSEGTLKRMLTLGVSRPVIILGKLLPYVIVGATQFACMMAVGLYVVPLLGDQTLDFGDQPLVLIPITLVCSFAATSYGLMVASLSRTPEQAAVFGPTSVVILSLLGGVMVPHFVMPAILQKAALVSPLYWGHKAYLDAFLHGAGLAEVSLSLQVLFGFGVACLAIASFRVAK